MEASFKNESIYKIWNKSDIPRKCYSDSYKHTYKRKYVHTEVAGTLALMLS